MVQNNPSDVPLLQRIFHPTVLSEAGNTAFAHALVIAMAAKAKLTILHVSADRYSSWTDFPGVRETLERWGLLPKNSERGDVVKLGLEVQKVQMIHDDPIESITTHLKEHGADLIILATDQHKDGVQWFQRSVATSVARKSREMTLFLPKGREGFVSLDDGSISLKNILIPVAPVPSAKPAMDVAARLVSGLHCESGLFTLLHVGKAETMPSVICPEVAGWGWNRMTRNGEVSEIIHQVRGEMEADLIVMATDGRNGFLDVLCESHSERVLQELSCPLLTIPVDGWMATVL